MKKSILIISGSAILLLAFQSFQSKSTEPADSTEKVTALFKNSCYDCHSNDASGDKSREALNFDEWNEYKASRKISKLEAICEVVEKGKMPPEKYLKKNPDKALSDDQQSLVCSWTEGELEKLMEGN